MDDRLFDEKAVARILRRTAELQGARQQRPATGLSLDELKTLAMQTTPQSEPTRVATGSREGRLVLPDGDRLDIEDP